MQHTTQNEARENIKDGGMRHAFLLNDGTLAGFGMERGEKLIRISYINGRYFVFDLESVKHIREEYLIIGTLSGTLSTLPQQNILLGLPVQLTQEEALWLVDQKIAYIDGQDEHGKSGLESLRSQLGYQTYRFFKSFNKYAVLPGMRFGGKYLVYNGDPLRYHAQYIVDPRRYGGDIGLHNIINSGRLATGVKKQWVVAGEKEDGSTKCYSVEWAGFG